MALRHDVSTGTRTLLIVRSHLDKLGPELADLRLTQTPTYSALAPLDIVGEAGWRFDAQQEIKRRKQHRQRPGMASRDSVHATVYRGLLRQDNDTDSTEVQVICKLLSGQDVKRIIDEADIYANELRGLQGSAVPRFYGLFEGGARGINWACLVMEDCGSNAIHREGPYVGIPSTQKGQIFSIVKDIHEVGIQHSDNDFAFSYNVVGEVSGDYRIVGFGRAVRHTCKSEIESTPGKTTTSSCRELALVLKQLEHGIEWTRLGEGGRSELLRKWELNPSDDRN